MWETLCCFAPCLAVLALTFGQSHIPSLWSFGTRSLSPASCKGTTGKAENQAIVLWME